MANDLEDFKKCLHDGWNMVIDFGDWMVVADPRGLKTVEICHVCNETLPFARGGACKDCKAEAPEHALTIRDLLR